MAPSGGLTRPKGPRALWLAVGASVIIHAAGLLSDRLAWSSDADEGLSSPPLASVVHLRMLSAGGEPQGSSGAPHRLTEPPAGIPQPLPEGPGERTSTAEIAVPPLRDEPQRAAAVSAPVEAPVVRDKAATDLVVDAANMVDGYVLRKALTVPPVPVDEVRLAWPAGGAALGRQQAVFSVFIDDEGVVRRMVADGPTLAPMLEEAARGVFMATRFQPGRVDGRAVKALIRVEVVFDNTLPVAEAASAPSVPRIVSSQNL